MRSFLNVQCIIRHTHTFTEPSFLPSGERGRGREGGEGEGGRGEREREREREGEGGREGGRLCVN